MDEEEESDQHPDLSEAQPNGGIRLDNWNGHLAVNV